ncbi:hypothetical protein P171DRAFT_427616 [Karstenula rhodostoma CBS 690.94]|uniref:Uncharacterized protein n=1 Tax=Karstenula rhodostoma CBS 690.94 TaxID=1392251 RepID=A0A9P4UEY4_9PLEO|nr:hypothetical protein P171DRAFT_427616 [Karstenula rhodostoma CBS 690.94]
MRILCLDEEIKDAERVIAKMHEAQLDCAKILISIMLPRRRSQTHASVALWSTNSQPNEKCLSGSFCLRQARETIRSLGERVERPG